MNDAYASHAAICACDAGDWVCMWARLWSGVTAAAWAQRMLWQCRWVCDSARKWHSTTWSMLELLQLLIARTQSNALAAVSAFFLFIIDCLQSIIK